MTLRKGRPTAPKQPSTTSISFTRGLDRPAAPATAPTTIAIEAGSTGGIAAYGKPCGILSARKRRSQCTCSFLVNRATVELRPRNPAMPRPRSGTFEIATVNGHAVYRGRLRLADGTRSDRFDLPLEMNERQ